MSRYTPLSHFRRPERVPQSFPIPCPSCQLPLEGSPQHSPPAVVMAWLSPYLAVARSGYWELTNCRPCERCGYQMPSAEADALTDTIADELTRGIDRRE